MKTVTNKNINIQFKVWCPSYDRVNYRLLLMGSLPELGAWNIYNALEAYPTKDLHVWSVHTSLPVLSNFEWTWVKTKRNRTLSEWERAGVRNRVLDCFSGTLHTVWGEIEEVFIQSACCVEISTFRKVEEGYMLMLSGSTPTTGMWDVKDAVPASEFPKRSGYWKASVMTDAFSTLDFKWTIVKEKLPAKIVVQEKEGHSVFCRRGWMRIVAPWSQSGVVVVETSMLNEQPDTVMGRSDILVKEKQRRLKEISEWEAVDPKNLTPLAPNLSSLKQPSRNGTPPESQDNSEESAKKADDKTTTGSSSTGGRRIPTVLRTVNVDEHSRTRQASMSKSEKLTTMFNKDYTSTSDLPMKGTGQVTTQGADRAGLDDDPARPDQKNLGDKIEKPDTVGGCDVNDNKEDQPSQAAPGLSPVSGPSFSSSVSSNSCWSTDVAQIAPKGDGSDFFEQKLSPQTVLKAESNSDDVAGAKGEPCVARFTPITVPYDRFQENTKGFGLNSEIYDEYLPRITRSICEENNESLDLSQNKVVMKLIKSALEETQPIPCAEPYDCKEGLLSQRDGDYTSDSPSSDSGSEDSGNSPSTQLAPGVNLTPWDSKQTNLIPLEFGPRSIVNRDGVDEKTEEFLLREMETEHVEWLSTRDAGFEKHLLDPNGLDFGILPDHPLIKVLSKMEGSVHGTSAGPETKIELPKGSGPVTKESKGRSQGDSEILKPISPIKYLQANRSQTHQYGGTRRKTNTDLSPPKEPAPHVFYTAESDEMTLKRQTAWRIEEQWGQSYYDAQMQPAPDLGMPAKENLDPAAASFFMYNTPQEYTAPIYPCLDDWLSLVVSATPHSNVDHRALARQMEKQWGDCQNLSLQFSQDFEKNAAKPKPEEGDGDFRGRV